MRRVKTIIAIFFLFSSLIFSQKNTFLLGNENLIANHYDLLKDKKIALVINRTSLLQNKTNLLDTLQTLGFEIKKIFSLEHGFAGMYSPGENVRNEGKINSVPIISLYGKKKKPSHNDLKNIDLIIYDIQDVGVRFYTYISSLKLIMEAAARGKKRLIVTDRPNPQTGNKIEGEILNKDFQSFVGISQIPILYGMTIGELARYFKDEILSEEKVEVPLTVIPMKNYEREKPFHNYIPFWIPPSPNLRSINSSLLYPGLCFLEATNISEGRGTEKPFEQFGAPFINSSQLLDKMKSKFSSIDLTITEFKPEKSSRYKPKYSGKLCYGIKARVKSNNFNPVNFGIFLLKTLKALYPTKLKINYQWLAKLWGNRNLGKYLKGEISEETFFTKIKIDEKEFSAKRKRYLIYE